ncbi:MAG: metallophosphoesterase [Cyclobacteriaceae bacterium]|nr:metallophosphoesterase [Cyclobacteriaceae bacterium]
MFRILTVLFFAVVFLLIDYYVFQAVLVISRDWSSPWKNLVRYGYWVPTVLSMAALAWWAFDNPYRYSASFRNWVLTLLITTYFSKLFAVLILFVDDVRRGVLTAWSHIRPTPQDLPGTPISRSDFLSKTALVAAGLPLGAFAYGIISGAHDYHVKRQTVYLPNLPKSFDGITIGQVSDIHSGSFWNKTAVKGGVEMFLAEKPDVIFFTGDLVNNETSEVNNYLPVFEKLRAPLGVFSTTGNHDYGDYRSWNTKADKARNFQDLINAHKQMGFRILMNEHEFLEESGDKLAVIGIENWGAIARFPKYGKLDRAHNGTGEAAVKLLLSHDPSHWDAQVRTEYPDIDVMFAGHTHGFQFGVEIGGFKWSPSQYIYKQWAGLYQKGRQYLYVNRGFGYLAYPGRVGIPPELTLLTLKRG